MAACTTNRTSAINTGRSPGWKRRYMITSWHLHILHIFHVTGPLWGEFTGHWWIPFTETCDVEFLCFLWCYAFHLLFTCSLLWHLLLSSLLKSCLIHSQPEINTSCWFHGNLTCDKDITRAISSCQIMLHIEFNAVIVGRPIMLTLAWMGYNALIQSQIFFNCYFHLSRYPYLLKMKMEKSWSSKLNHKTVDHWIPLTGASNVTAFSCYVSAVITAVREKNTQYENLFHLKIQYTCLGTKLSSLVQGSPHQSKYQPLVNRDGQWNLPY